MDSKEIIYIRYQYSINDFIESMHFYKSTTRFRIVRLILSPLFILIGINNYTIGGLSWYTWLPFLIGLDTYFDFTGSLRCYFAFKANSDMYKNPFDITIDEQDGITFKTDTYEARRFWAAYNKYYENKKMFILVSGKGQYGIYPKKAFSDADQLRRFRNLIKKKIISGR